MSECEESRGMTAADVLCEAMKVARERKVDCLAVVMRTTDGGCEAAACKGNHSTVLFIVSNLGHDPDVTIALLEGAKHMLLSNKTGTVHWSDLKDEEDEQ